MTTDDVTERRLRRLEDMLAALARIVSRMEGSHPPSVDRRSDAQWLVLEEALAGIQYERERERPHPEESRMTVEGAVAQGLPENIALAQYSALAEAQEHSSKIEKMIHDGVPDEVWDRVIARFLRRRGLLRVIEAPQETEEP